MKGFLPLLVLLAQTPEPDLGQDYLATFGGTPHAAVTIVATHQDGRPVKGHIACSGYWFKYADEDTTAHGWGLPFRADARGAIVMNPRKDDAAFTCWAVGYDERVLIDLTGSQRVFQLQVQE